MPSALQPRGIPPANTLFHTPIFFIYQLLKVSFTSVSTSQKQTYAAPLLCSFASPHPPVETFQPLSSFTPDESRPDCAFAVCLWYRFSSHYSGQLAFCLLRVLTAAGFTSLVFSDSGCHFPFFWLAPTVSSFHSLAVHIANPKTRVSPCFGSRRAISHSEIPANNQPGHH